MSSFDPSLLDNKDRDELSQIAESLGKKPPARAKKADIVALILELAGVSPAPADAAPAEPASEPTADVDRADDGDTPQASDDAAPVAPADAPAPAPPASDDSPAPQRPVRGGGRGPNGGPGANADQQSRNQPRGGQQSQPGGAPQPNGNGNGNANQQGGNQQGGNQQGRGDQQPRGEQQRGEPGNQQPAGQANGNQRPPQPNPEDADGGNRRRRRRGRGQDQGGEDGFQGDPVDAEGLLDLREEGYGFLRSQGYLPSTDDVYVSVKQVRQFALRKGDLIRGKSRPAGRNEKNPALLQIDVVNGGDPEEMKQRARFEDLTPVAPADAVADVAGQAVAKGQRALVAVGPGTDTAALVRKVASSIAESHPDLEVVVLLVDARPEDVTAMTRGLAGGTTQVVASTFDRAADEHTHVAELVIERAKRQVEAGQHVVVVVDGITSLARAYNLAAPATGRVLPGGLEASALHHAKRFLGAARNLEDGGSLAIVGTIEADTRSVLDQEIHDELARTANLTIGLDRE